MAALDLERDGPVLRVWLDRVSRRNALDTGALEEIEALFTSLRKDFQTRVVVLGGRGPDFCAGADRRSPPGHERMSSDSGSSDRERRYWAQLGLRACRAIQDAEPLTLARIHGHAVGGGFALALACDLRVAARDAIFHVPEVDLGVPLTWGASARLVHEVGAARAREIILLCDRIDAERAEQWGMAHRVVDPEELDTAVNEWVQRLVDKPEVAVHMTKTQFRAYGNRARLGDVTEGDGDLLLEASRRGIARQSFPNR